MPDFGNYSFEIVRKKIKNIYFRVYPSKEKIVVSAPVHLDPETLNSAILSKSNWLYNQVKKGASVKPDPVKTYTTGEKVLFKGKRYSLYVDHQDTRSKVFITGDDRINLVINHGSDVEDREKIITGWYKKQLKRSIAELVAKWQPVIGVTVNEFNVRKMKTRWGSCNINAARIWLNLALVKFEEPFLEYVIVHEMVHLLERKHNARFKEFMNQFIPGWRKLKKELDLSGL
jgi:predicted metal-dependent hydrolase